MSTHSLFNTSTFRLTASLGFLCAVAIVVLLGLVYQETAGVLSRRVDHIILSEAGALAHTSPERILSVIKEQAARDPLTEFSLYAQSGERVAGRGGPSPSDLRADGAPQDFETAGRAPHRAAAVRLPWGETLVVERDTSQLVEPRRIIVRALIWSGGAIVLSVGVLSVSLSLDPLRRVRAMQTATAEIAGGDLAARLPVNGSGDELDALAGIVNAMMAEIERLLTDARTVGEGIAHELRTPLTRLRMILDHAAEGLDASDHRKALLDACIAETDGLLSRFRAILRIAAVVARGRRTFIAPMSLSAMAGQAVELFEPLAAERSVSITSDIAEGVDVAADADLLFEALVNLLDNAIKFSPADGRVHVKVTTTPNGPQVSVGDGGSGIRPEDLPFVTKRFYRGAEAAGVPGHGLGLSLVAAVADLHGFALRFEDAGPGTIVRLACAPAPAMAMSGGRRGSS